MRDVILDTVFIKLALDFIFGSTRAIALRITLNHEAVNNAMERKAIIEA